MGNQYNNDVWQFAGEHPIISFLVASSAISGIVTIAKCVTSAISGKPVEETNPVNINLTVPDKSKEASKEETVEPEIEVVETEPEESDETENT